jgi:hypothetical protein
MTRFAHARSRAIGDAEGQRARCRSPSAPLLNGHALDVRTHEFVDVSDVRALEHVASRITYDESDACLHRSIGALSDALHDDGRAHRSPLPLPVLSHARATEQPPAFPAVGPVNIWRHRRENSVEIAVVERVVQGSHAVDAVGGHASDCCPRRRRPLQIAANRRREDAPDQLFVSRRPRWAPTAALAWVRLRSRSCNHGCAGPTRGVVLVMLVGCPKMLAHAVERRRAPNETRTSSSSPHGLAFHRPAADVPTGPTGP